MSAARGRGSPRHAEPVAIAKLRARLAEADETLRAIRSGEVDAVVVSGRRGDQVFTLQGAGHAYRILIESMNEGALTLASDKTILYANQCFAGMVGHPLEQVIGSSFRRFLSAADRKKLEPLVRRSRRGGDKIQVLLHACGGTPVPAQVSIRALARNGSDRATVGLVVTDMSESHRTQELLRTLAHRVVQVQEAERGRVALELHDHITQLLCAVVFRSQALVERLSQHDGPSTDEAIKLREMLGQTAREVERISNNLTPHVLRQLGLEGALREARSEFARRTGIKVGLTCAALASPLSAETELALYRIVQEALGNVEQHAGARHVTLRLGQRGACVRLSIRDDGAGFDTPGPLELREGAGGLGLHNMRERAAYVGGVLTIKSSRRRGTAIEVRVPALAA